MNYMEQVSKMLGIELEEEFKVSSFGNRKFKFTKNGIEYFNEPNEKWSDIGLFYSGLLYNILTGSYKIVKIKNPILDDIEKEYLSAVIKPFRNRIKYIEKKSLKDESYEYVAICYYENITDDMCMLYFPMFEKGTMYKRMKADKKYIIEELGL